ncbi:MAG: ABC transporter permease [Dehalococcoidia bacterium]
MYKPILQNSIATILAVTSVTLVLIILQVKPFEIYGNLFDGSFGNLDKISRTLLIATIMSLAGFALVITFSTGLWNIGIEGQMLFGAIGATFIARTFFGELFFSPIIIIFFGGLFGSFLGLLSAILKTRFNVHEIFGGLGINFVASGLIVYLVIGPWKREGIASTGGTDLFPLSSWINGIGGSNFPIYPILIAIITFLILFLLLSRTSLGLKLIATGANKDAADKFKIDSVKYITYSFLFAGAIGGIAGAIQAASIHHKLVPNIAGGYGFLGILIALIAGRNLFTVVIISIIFASIMVGGVQLQLRLGLDSSFPYIIESVFVISWLIIKASKIDAKLLRFITNKGENFG